MADLTVLVLTQRDDDEAGHWLRSARAAGDAVRAVAVPASGARQAARAVTTRWTMVVHARAGARPGSVARHLAAQRRHPSGVVAGRPLPAPSWRAAPPPGLAALQGGPVSGPADLVAAALGDAGDLADPEGLDLLLALRDRRPGGGITRLDLDPVAPAPDLRGRAARQAVARVRACRRRPELLRELLAGFEDAPLREVVARRVLLAARMPWAVALVARLAGQDVDAARRAGERAAFWAAVRRQVRRGTWLRLTCGVPVLGYHAVGGPGEPAGRYTVPARRLALQLATLRVLGRRVVPLAVLADALRTGALPPLRAAVVTFDDGYRDNATRAAPLLQRLRIPATFFLVSGRMGGANVWDPSDAELAGRPVMDWEEARRLPPAIDLGGHTISHPRLPDLVDDERIRDEVAGSVRRLRTSLGVEARHFAYPHGARDARAVRAAAEAGCSCAVTTDVARVALDSPLLELPRLEVRGDDILARFVLKVLLGYHVSPPPVAAGRFRRSRIPRRATRISDRSGAEAGKAR